MGNVPNRWAGRGLTLALALLAALGAFLGGQWVAHRLAYGFSFEGYVHPGATGYASSDALLAVGLAGGIGAALAALLLAGPVASGTRAWSRRLRYLAPRVASPTSPDVHAARLVSGLGVGLGCLAALAAYVLLRTVPRVSPFGFEILVAVAASAGAGVAALVAGLTSFSWTLSGRLVPDPRKNLLARVSLAGMRHAKATVALVLVATIVAGAYATTLTTSVDVADALPRGDPNTAAAHDLTQKFKSSFTQQVTFHFRVLDATDAAQAQIYARDAAARVPLRTTNATPGNITDEVYVRAMDEVVAFVLAQTDASGKPIFVGSVGAPDFYKLVNWTLAGGQDPQPRPGPLAVDPNATYSLPDTSRQGELQYRNVQEGVDRVAAVHSALDAVVSPSWRQTALLVTVDPKSSLSSQEIGDAALRIRDAWLAKTREDPNTFKAFGDANPPLFSVDLPLADAHATALTKRDFSVLLPVIGVFVAITLFIAFRNLVSVIVAFSTLGLATVWTFGVMAWLRIPLNTLNIAVVPLIMGVGIDYAIHVVNEHQEHRSAGLSSEDAWIEASSGGSLALFVGMLTTAAGLLVMAASPSLLVAQLGILASVALVACYLLALVFIPALVAILAPRLERSRRPEFAPSSLMPRLASGVSRARWFVLLAVVLLAASAVASGATLRREAFGDPPRNWLPTDPLRQEHEKAIGGFYDTGADDVKANVLIFEGDITDPAAHRYIANVTSTLRANAEKGSWTDGSGTPHRSRVVADTLRDLPFLVNTYITVRNGVSGAAALTGGDALSTALQPLGQKSPTDTNQAYPATKDAIKRTLDDAYASPLFQLANLFVDHPAYEMTVTIFSVKAATYEDAAEAWAEVQDAVAKNDAARPAGMHASFFGNTAINYLFVAKEVPWLGYMSVVTNVLVVLIVLGFTRDLRTTIVVGLCNALTTALWLGALTLPFVDIGLSIGLALPLFFIFAMGSDYALHLALRSRKVGTLAAYRGVGKGVLFSFAATFGAFLVFTQISDLAGRRAIVATVIAIGIVFLVSVALVPAFFPVTKAERDAARTHRARILAPDPADSGEAAAAQR